MSQFLLPRGGTVNPNLPLYGKLDNLRAIHRRNIERMRTFYSMGNRVLPNQHPLVQFLLQLSINVNWSTTELYNYIEQQSKKIASNVGITSLYNRGKCHELAVYPESNHHTLIVMPFEKNNWDVNDISTEVETIGACLIPIMTTSYQHYWNPDQLIDGIQRKNEQANFTILELDVYQFVFGYYWYLKDRQQKGINVGLTPHHYVLLCLIETYVYHNSLVNMNLVINNEEVIIQKSGFALESYFQQQNDFNTWQRSKMLSERVASAGEWIRLCRSSIPDVHYEDLFFYHRPQTLMFVQMGWVYTLASLYWARGYLYFMDFVGSYDGITTSRLKSFYKIPVNYNSNQIKDPNWNSFFINVWKDLSNRE